MRAKIRSLESDVFSALDLRALLTTEAWVGQLHPGGPTYKLLASLPGCTPAALDGRAFMLLCILWCAGTLTSKADALFELINPHYKSRTSISASDPAWEYTFTTLGWIATAVTYGKNKVKFKLSLL